LEEGSLRFAISHLRTAQQQDRSDGAYSEVVAIRRPSEADIPGLAAIFSEMQCHYGRPVSDATATAAATLACKPPTSTFDPHTLIALVGTELIGSLVLNVTFPAFELTRSLYIRDLYVAKTMRRHGVGRALVKAAARLALTEGFSAIEWTTDADNRAARTMYEACGATWLNRTYSPVDNIGDTWCLEE
jgi:GNAT superfamily N-acetyltransferase